MRVETDRATLMHKNEETQPGVMLGTLSVTGVEASTVCDGEIFDPANLTDGIGAPKDEMFAARQEAYAILLALRSK